MKLVFNPFTGKFDFVNDEVVAGSVAVIPASSKAGKIIYFTGDSHAYLDNGITQKKMLLDGDVSDTMFWSIVLGG